MKASHRTCMPIDQVLSIRTQAHCPPECSQASPATYKSRQAPGRYQCPWSIARIACQVFTRKYIYQCHGSEPCAVEQLTRDEIHGLDLVSPTLFYLFYKRPCYLLYLWFQPYIDVFKPVQTVYTLPIHFQPLPLKEYMNPSISVFYPGCGLVPDLHAKLQLFIPMSLVAVARTVHWKYVAGCFYTDPVSGNHFARQFMLLDKRQVFLTTPPAACACPGLTRLLSASDAYFLFPATSAVSVRSAEALNISSSTGRKSVRLSRASWWSRLPVYRFQLASGQKLFALRWS